MVFCQSAGRLSRGVPADWGAENFVSTKTFSTPSRRLSNEA
jgi:hypothetical protein